MHQPRIRFVVGLMMAILWACTSVPKAAPLLSSELAGRVEESQRAHLDVVRLYMASRRRQVDEFLEHEWIPTFWRQALSQPAVEAAWQEAARTNDTAVRMEFLVGLNTRVQRQIDAKRQELVGPLDEAERLIIRKIEEHYDEMLAMNSTLTALVSAAAEVTETQQLLARRVDPQRKLTDLLDTADRITGALVGGMDDLARRRAVVDSLLTLLRKP